jgi:hypothetical protein
LAPTLFATVVVKPRDGQTAESLAPMLARDVSKADPDLPLYFVGTARAQIDSFIAQGRIIATMFWIFGIVAVVLAAVGIYGVMSFSVSQRTQEFGVRMALGAGRGRILGMVGFDHWTPNGCQLHVAADTPAAWPCLVRSMFQYVFGERKKGVVVGWVLSSNERCLSLAMGLGFVEVARIRDGWATGVDLVGIEMRKETCRWLKPAKRKAA